MDILNSFLTCLHDIMFSNTLKKIRGKEFSKKNFSSESFKVLLS